MHLADAEARDLASGDVVRLYNDRGACLAVVETIEGIVPGVVQMATGAWLERVDPNDDRSLEIHGNPNVLTRDVGTSRLAQGTSAHSCLVQIGKYLGELPDISVFDQPEFIERGESILPDS